VEQRFSAAFSSQRRLTQGRRPCSTRLRAV